MDNYNYSGIPVGFGLALSVNERALNGYSKMTEAEKERLILKCKDARSDQEVEEIVDSIALEELPDEISEELKGEYSDEAF